MNRFRMWALFVMGLFVMVIGSPAVALSTHLTQTDQRLTPSSVIINYVSTMVDDPNGLTTVELFDGGIGETDLSDLILIIADERDDPTTVDAISLEGFRTDENGFFTVGGPEESPKAEEQPMHEGNPIGATHVGLLSAVASDQIDTDILAKELLSDLIILGNSSTEPNSRALEIGIQPLAISRPVASNQQRGGTATLPPPCGAEATPIHAVQGSGDASPLEGEVVVIEGIVIGDFQDTQTQLRGFYLQEEDDDQDDDSATSEGIFIFDNGFGVDVTTGDVVRVTGEAKEAFSLTEITKVTSVTICDRQQTPEPTIITLPESEDGELERVEGMLVEIDTEMTVVQNYFLGRYGQLTLAADGRIFQPTSLFPPESQEANALADENHRRLLVLDDGQDIRGLGDNPTVVPYIGAAPPRVIRAGDTVTNLIGIIDFGRINSAPAPDTGRDYRLQPVEEPIFSSVNQRTEEPDDVGGTLRIASFNVLNYFNGDGNGAGFPTSRGARNFADFQRQRAKIIMAIKAIDADIIGLMELENDGYGPDSAIQDMVSLLNAMAPPDTEYAAVDPGLDQLGSDEIAVGFIYKSTIVSPVGKAATLDSGAFDQNLPSGRSRQPLAQTFADASGEKLTVVVNHLKSKRPSDSPTGGNADMGLGVGAWNERRTEAAKDLLVWLAADPTESGDPDVLIIGDLNAYAMETPVTAITDLGFVNLLAKANEATAYSYIFDGQAGYLDHALASPSLIRQISGSTEWHINADEPKVIDYDSRFNPPGYYSSDSFRSSDHDPLIIGVVLGKDKEGSGEEETEEAAQATQVAIAPTISATALPTEAYPTVPFPTVSLTATTSGTLAVTPTGTVLAPIYTPVLTSTLEATSGGGPNAESANTPTATRVVYEPTATWTPIDTPTPESTVEPTTNANIEATVVYTPPIQPTPTWTPVVPELEVQSTEPGSGNAGTTTLPPSNPNIVGSDPGDTGTTITVPTADDKSMGDAGNAEPKAPLPQPTAPAPSIATPQPSLPPTPIQSYVVNKGEFLSLIARRFSVTIVALAKANHIEIHAPLWVGQQLIVPAPTSNVECVRYLTVSGFGDTIKNLILFEELDVLPDGLAAVNGVWPLEVLPGGTQVCLPDIYSDGYISERSYGERNSGARSIYGYYIVEEGETLSHIATRFGYRVSALRRLNGLGSPHKIYAGQRLILPNKHSN